MEGCIFIKQKEYDELHQKIKEYQTEIRELKEAFKKFFRKW